MTLFDLCEKASKTVHSFLELNENDKIYKDTKTKVLESYHVLEEALDKFTLDEISISYNGGKDCLVMLVIFLSVIYDKHKQILLENFDLKINTIFINTEKAFDEMDQFLKDSITEYQLSFIELNDTLKSGFENYLAYKPMIKTIIVGMRRIDPYGADLKFFEKTDHNWPDFLRVHPVLNWEYVEIWFFLKKTHIPYCKLYDYGYTSIGGIHNTVKNPCLMKDPNDESKGYSPAYSLKENDKERLSRI